MIAQIEIIFKQLDSLLRNANNNSILETRKLSIKLLEYFSAPEIIEHIDSLNENVKKNNLEIAVKLHNKARNLVISSLAEIRTILKAASAWMLYLYGGDTYKIFAVVIKILSKCGQELLLIDTMLAYKCLKATIGFWKRSILLMMQLNASILELQELKISVFWSYLEVIHIIRQEKNQNHELRIHISETVELVQALPSRLKYNFAEQILIVAYQMADITLFIDDAIHYFNMVLNTIDIAMLPDTNVNVLNKDENQVEDIKISKTDMLKVKVNAQIALSFIYMDKKQFDKALACVNTIENSIKLLDRNFNNTIKKNILYQVNYAKFLIFHKDKDIKSAESSLWELFNSALIPFQVALDCVKLLIDYNQDDEKNDDENNQNIIKFYKYLTGKYPKDPELTKIRLSHMHAILSNIKSSEEDNLIINKKALEISQSIIEDHTNEEWLQQQNNYEYFKKIFIDRIGWHKSMNHYGSVINWCQCFQSLLIQISDEKELYIGVALNTANALLNMGKFEEAYQNATIALNEMKSTKTIEMLFKTMLHHPNYDNIFTMQTLMKTLEDHISIKGDLFINAQLENLSRLILCCYTSQESILITNVRRDNMIKLLLHEWLHYYVKCKAWKSISNENMNISVNDIEITYISVLTELMQWFINTNLECHMKSIVSPMKEDNKSIIDEQQIDEPMDISVTESNNLGESDKQIIIGNQEYKNSGLVISDSPDLNFIACNTGTPSSNNINMNFTDLNSNIYKFKCNIKLFQNEFISYLNSLIDTMYMIEKEGDSIHCLGSISDLQWIADLAWNIATLLSKDRDHLSLFYKNDDTSLKSLDENNEQYLLMIAQLYEIVYNINEKTENTVDLPTCLLLSASARIDADSYIKHSNNIIPQEELTMSESNCNNNSSSMSSSSHIINQSKEKYESNDAVILSNSLLQARYSIQKAKGILKAQLDFEDENNRKLRQTALVYEFSILCRLKDSNKLNDFILEHQNEFFYLNPEDLIFCSKMSRNEQGISIESTRTLLNYTLQVNMRSISPNYSLMGEVYRDLIELSPSRTNAFEKVEEFEQLTFDIARKGLSFNVCDVDHIVALAYNYGVTLVDLDQILLAEKFVTKSLNLIPFTSDTLKSWLPKIQDTYAHILQLKADSTKINPICYENTEIDDINNNNTTNSITYNIANKNDLIAQNQVEVITVIEECKSIITTDISQVNNKKRNITTMNINSVTTKDSAISLDLLLK